MIQAFLPNHCFVKYKLLFTHCTTSNTYVVSFYRVMVFIAVRKTDLFFCFGYKEWIHNLPANYNILNTTDANFKDILYAKINAIPHQVLQRSYSNKILIFHLRPSRNYGVRKICGP
jgi:hypothetical protein